MQDFYRKFQLISKFPLFPSYLRWVYRKAIGDSLGFPITPLGRRKNPTCLLCGVCGELVSGGLMSASANTIRAISIRKYLGIHASVHDDKELESCIKNSGFRFKRSISPIPLL